MEKLAEMAPTDYYYDSLLAYLVRKYPLADKHLLDHLVTLEAFLDKSIQAGFSYGVDKASVAVTEGKLLGHFVSRNGARPDGEAVQAIRDFAPLREKLHIQQFCGSTNWLRWYLPAEYSKAAKVLGEWQRPGAIFPDGGLGTADTPGGRGVRAL
jgi:hypothetical protein